MPEQSREHVRRPEHHHPEELAEDTGATAVRGASPSAAERAEALKRGMDDVLGEIDSVLESNAEDFVRQYVQKGGE